MPIVHVSLLPLSFPFDGYSFDVPPNVPLYAVADLIARETLQPAEYMTFFDASGTQISRYSAVLEELRVSVLVRPTLFFYVERHDGCLVYYQEGKEERKPWDSEAVELEDAVVFSREPIEIGNYTVRYY